MISASMAQRKPSAETPSGTVKNDNSSSAGESPSSTSAWATVCKYIVMFNGAMAGAKALWDNINMLAVQSPSVSEFVLQTAFYAGALTVYVFAAFLPLGLIVTSLVDASELPDKWKTVLCSTVVLGCLGWGGYKAFLNHDAPLVPLYTRIIGAVALAAVGALIYQGVMANRAKK